MSSLSTWSVRLREAWSALFCQGGPVFIEEGSSADRAFATSRRNVRTADGQKLFMLECAQPDKRCSRCPRGQAYRQLLSCKEHGGEDLHVMAAVNAIESEVGDRQGKVAEVHDRNAKAWTSRRETCVRHGNLEPYPILDPVSPSVVQAEHSAQHCQRCGDDLHRGGFHAATVAPAREAT